MKLFLILCGCFLSIANLQAAVVKDPQELRVQLEKIENEVRSLPKYSTLEQQHVVLLILNFFQTTLSTHENWLAREQFPLLENETPHITSSAAIMHRMIVNWISDLSLLANSAKVDVDKFLARAYQLIGVVKAQLEVEEKLLIPRVNNDVSKQK